MMEKKQCARSRLRDLALCGTFAGVLAVCAWVTIPGPVPFTLQTLGIFAVLGLLGGRRGTVAVGVYLVLGALGLPVFSGFRGGFGMLLGPTGGYLFGFLLSAVLYWLLTGLWGERPGVQLAAMLLGLLCCYAVGTGWFLLVSLRESGPVSLTAALGKCVVPFLLPDGGKLALAYGLTLRLRPYARRRFS